MTSIESFIEWILTLISQNIYPGVLLAALIETIFPPIPSEAVFPLAGYIIQKNEMNSLHIIGVGIAGGTGATLGGFIIFLIARKLGRIGLTRYMKYAKINKKSLDKADNWFSKYGDKSVIIGRMIPGIRELVSIPAGIFNMKIPKFLIFTFIGSCGWSVLLTAIGYYFGIATIEIFNF